MAYTKNKRRKLSRKAVEGQTGKRCTGGCQGFLTLKSFSINRTKPDGLEQECFDCRARYRRERKHNFKQFSGRYPRTGKIARIGSHKAKGWQRRMRQLKATGHVIHDNEFEARDKKSRMRFIWGHLRIVGE